MPISGGVPPDTVCPASSFLGQHRPKVVYSFYSFLTGGKERYKQEWWANAVLLHTLYTRLYILAGQFILNETLCAQLHHMMRFLVLICAPTRLASYIVTANVPVFYLAPHQDQDLPATGRKTAMWWRPPNMMARHNCYLPLPLCTVQPGNH